MSFRRPLLSLVLLALVGLPAPGRAEPIPSRAEGTGGQASADREQVRAVIARAEVAQALRAQGLAPEEVEARLVQLSPEELRALAGHLDQVQAAGAVPNYIWILLGILLAVTILAAVF